MATRYSIAAARSSLPSIVDLAESGAEIELTRRGKPVAVVVSLRLLERLRGQRAGFRAAYETFMKRHPPSEVGVEAEVFGSARDRSAGRRVAL